MRRHWQGTVVLGGLLAAPLVAQEPSLQPLAFLQGCWEGPTTGAGPHGVIEERFTAPSINVMLGTTRWLVNGRTTHYALTVIRTDGTGVSLTSYQQGAPSPIEARLAASAGDSAVFESPSAGTDWRVTYRRDASGRLMVTTGGYARQQYELRTSPCAMPPGVVAVAPPAALPPAGPDRSGRVMTYVTQTLNGLWLGLAIPAAADVDDETAYGLGLLLGPGTGLFFAKALNDSRPVSLGQATTITWGGWWGLWNGIAISEINWEGDDTNIFRNSAIGLVAGTAVGTFIARNPISAGDASLAAHASFWGTWYGIVAQGLIDPEDTGDDFLIVLTAGNVGLLAGAYATKHVEMSSGRVWITTASGLAGLVAGLGIDVLAKLEDDNAFLVPAVTSFVGLATGLYATRDIDRRHALYDFRPDNALLGYRDGRFRVGVPAPTPAMVPRDNGQTRRYVPGLKFTLLDLRH